MITITKILVVAITALSSVRALPQPIPSTTSTTTTPTPAPTADQAQLIRDLLTAPTALKRFQRLLTSSSTLLTGDALRKLTVFSFANATAAPNSQGGATKAATIDSFPILTGQGISTTLGFLNPCGINTPHVHPRATEFLTLVSGTSLKFGYILENGLVPSPQNPQIAGTLSKYEGTVFPQGSIHFQFNDSCDDAVFVASLNSEDPGTSQVAQGFFALDAEVVDATLGFPGQIGGKGVKEFGKGIPANLARDVEGCLRRCGM